MVQTCRVHINTTKMGSILNPISKLLKTPVLFYATESKQWFGASKRNLPFCYAMERCPATNAFCAHCDQQADQQCARQKNAYAYHCHAGLIEVAYPVYIDNIYIGFLIIGQFRTKEAGLDKEYARKLALLCETEPDALYKKYHSQPLIGTEAVEGIKLVAGMINSRLLDEKVFSLEYHEVIKKVENYINQNISGPLPLKDIAQHVFMSSAYLSTTYKNVTGRNITDYIQERRVSTACFLIRTTSGSISNLAQETGFSDANYFTKVFKKKTGMTPREYRQRWKDGDIEE